MNSTIWAIYFSTFVFNFIILKKKRIIVLTNQINLWGKIVIVYSRWQRLITFNRNVFLLPWHTARLPEFQPMEYEQSRILGSRCAAPPPLLSPHSADWIKLIRSQGIGKGDGRGREGILFPKLPAKQKHPLWTVTWEIKLLLWFNHDAFWLWLYMLLLLIFPWFNIIPYITYLILYLSSTQTQEI